MIHTPICDLLGIEYPIFQGGMAWVADGKLAAAVSAGGGLGIIGAGNAPGSFVREQIQVVRSLTDKPFGVNVMLMSPFADEVAQVIAEEKVAVVTTGAGNPSKYMELWKNAGIKVIPVVASVSMAKLMTRVGATAVIAEGGESGGHIGELATPAPGAPGLRRPPTLPVIAAGGIGDGRGVAAAFMLGAVGVQLGTAFLVANECSIHPNYKEKVLKATDLAPSPPASAWVTRCAASRPPSPATYAKAEYTQISDEELEAMGVGALRLAVQEGDVQRGSFLAGEIAGMVNREQPAAEIIREIFAPGRAGADGSGRNG